MHFCRPLYTEFDGLTNANYKPTAYNFEEQNSNGKEHNKPRNEHSPIIRRKATLIYIYIYIYI